MTCLIDLFQYKHLLPIGRDGVQIIVTRQLKSLCQFSLLGIDQNDSLQAMMKELEEQFEAQQDEITSLDWGFSQKRGEGYLVVEEDCQLSLTYHAMLP